MSYMTESLVEEYAIQLLTGLGYSYLYGPDIAPDSVNPERSSFAEVLLSERVKSAIKRFNPSLPLSVQEYAFKEIQRINSSELITNNETFHQMLTEGIPVTQNKHGYERGDRIWLIDFEHPENNEFLVVNQFTIIENQANKRPDVILFVNGLPLVVIELNSVPAIN